MPHADLKYSDDLRFDTQKMFVAIEECILRHDPGAGVCKGRAYPASGYHHTHMLVEISILPKTHRDEAFRAALARDLEAVVTSHLTQPCFFTLSMSFSPPDYLTGEHVPARA